MNEAIGRYERSFPGLTTTVVTRKLLFVESRRVVSHSIEAPEQPTFIPRGVRPTGPDHPTGVHWRSLSTVWGSRPARTPLGMSRYTLVGQRPIQNRAKSSYTGLYRGLNPEAERVCVCVCPHLFLRSLHCIIHHRWNNSFQAGGQWTTITHCPTKTVIVR